MIIQRKLLILETLLILILFCLGFSSSSAAASETIYKQEHSVQELLSEIQIQSLDEDLQSTNIEGIFNFKSYISIFNDSPYPLVRPYVITPWYRPNYYDGLDKCTSCQWVKDPWNWIQGFKQNNSFYLNDPIGGPGSKGSVLYDIRLGDIQRYIDNRSYRNLGFLKIFGSTKISFACPVFSDNEADTSLKELLNPAIKFKALTNNANYPAITGLVLANLSFQGKSDNNPFLSNNVTKDGRPIYVNYQLKERDLNLQPLTTLDTLARGWWGYLQSKGLASPTNWEDWIYPMYRTAGVPDVQKRITTLPNCSLAQNKAGCNSQVLDDWDDGYNCAAWVSGRSAGGYVWDMLSDDVTGARVLNDLGYSPISCKNQGKLDTSVVVIAHCTENSSHNCINPSSANGQQYYWTHVQIKMPNGRWSSKTGPGPLLVYDDPSQMVLAFGPMHKCFAGTTFFQKFPSSTSEDERLGYNRRLDKFINITPLKLHPLENCKSIYEMKSKDLFQSEDIDYIILTSSQIPVDIKTRFEGLLLTWEGTQLIHTIIGFREHQIKLQEEVENEFKTFFNEYPEAKILLLKEIMCPRSGHEYRLTKIFSNINCDEKETRFESSRNCADNWLSILKHSQADREAQDLHLRIKL